MMTISSSHYSSTCLTQRTPLYSNAAEIGAKINEYLEISVTIAVVAKWTRPILLVGFTISEISFIVNTALNLCQQTATSYLSCRHHQLPFDP